VGLERGPLSLESTVDRLCGLVVRLPGYGSRGSGSIPGATQGYLNVAECEDMIWVHFSFYHDYSGASTGVSSKTLSVGSFITRSANDLSPSFGS
jgi:hypothetical protein